MQLAPPGQLITGVDGDVTDGGQFALVDEISAGGYADIAHRSDQRCLVESTDPRRVDVQLVANLKLGGRLRQGLPVNKLCPRRGERPVARRGHVHITCRGNEPRDNRITARMNVQRGSFDDRVTICRERSRAFGHDANRNVLGSGCVLRHIAINGFLGGLDDLGLQVKRAELGTVLENRLVVGHPLELQEAASIGDLMRRRSPFGRVIDVILGLNRRPPVIARFIDKLEARPRRQVVPFIEATLGVALDRVFAIICFVRFTAVPVPVMALITAKAIRLARPKTVRNRTRLALVILNVIHNTMTLIIDHPKPVRLAVIDNGINCMRLRGIGGIRKRIVVRCPNVVRTERRQVVLLVNPVVINTHVPHVAGVGAAQHL